MREAVKTQADGASLSHLSRAGSARGTPLRRHPSPGPLVGDSAMFRGVATARSRPADHDGAHVPLLALLLSVPLVLAVALFCVVTRPGLFPSLLALGLTPFVVFAATLGAFVLRDWLRRHG